MKKRRNRRIGNPPSSIYHHKTELPGAVGHHILHGLGLGKLWNKKVCLTRNEYNRAKIHMQYGEIDKALRIIAKTVCKG